MKRLFATTLRTYFSLIILITTFDLFVPRLVHQQTHIPKTNRLFPYCPNAAQYLPSTPIPFSHTISNFCPKSTESHPLSLNFFSSKDTQNEGDNDFERE